MPGFSPDRVNQRKPGRHQNKTGVFLTKEDGMLKNLSNRMVSTYVKKQEDARAVMERVVGNERGAGAVEYGLVIAVVGVRSFK